MSHESTDNAASPSPVPVTIVTGFLGAGKTSLLNHILTSSHGRRIAVLVNDFGAVNIDEALIEKRGGDLISLQNGCICCSLSAGLQVGAAQLVRRQPDHIVIETSGVSDPFEVAHAFDDPDLKPYAPLEGVVTVVDAELAPTLEGDMLRMAMQQVYAADIVVLNKIDLVDEAQHRRASAWLQEYAPRARVIEVEHGRVPLDLLFDIGGAMEIEKNAGLQEKSGSGHPDQPPFDTWTFVSDEPLSMRRLHDTLRDMPKTIFRAKGIVDLIEKPGYPVILQSTGKRATLTVGSAWESRKRNTRIVFIGSRGGVDADWLQSQLAGPVSNTDLASARVKRGKG